MDRLGKKCAAAPLTPAKRASSVPRRGETWLTYALFMPNVEGVVDDLFGPPPRNMGCGKPYLSPGARKEKLRQRAFRVSASRGVPYAELRTASAFSFLDGASLPEDLVARAVELDLPAVALVDRHGVYGAPRFYKAAKAAGIKALVGAEVTVEDEPARLTLLVESSTGYKNLCRLLTAAAHGRPKGSPRALWRQVEERAAGLHVLTHDSDPARLDRLAALFPGRLHLELARHFTRAGEWRNRRLLELAERLRLPLVATNGARYARAEDKSLHDVLTCIREHTTSTAPARCSTTNRERHLKSARGDGALVRRPAARRRQRLGARRSGSPSRSTTSAIASPTIRCRPARPPAPICASSPGTARAPASGRSPRGRRRRSRKSWR